jgi:hypothetical protein
VELRANVYPLLEQQTAMMGHIMRLLVAFTEHVGGSEAVEATFAGAGLPPRDYRFEAVYPEEDFAALFASAVSVLGVDGNKAQELFADYFMEVSRTLFSAIFTVSGSTKNFLLQLPHLHRSLPEAASIDRYTDKVLVQERSPEVLVIDYHSPHRLCRMLHRLLGLTADHYNDSISVEELSCAHEGAAHCRFQVTFHETPELP